MTVEDERGDKARLDWRVVVLSIIGFWIFYVLVVTFRAAIMDFPAQGEMALRRSYVTAGGIGVTIVFWMILRLFDERALWIRILAAIVLAVPAAVAIAGINYFVFNVYDPINLIEVEKQVPAELKPSAFLEIAEVAITRYFFVIAWASFYLALGFAQDVGAAERRAAGFARAAQTAELRALRYQVNPHFLFNTLNSLSALVMKGEKALADAMIMNLSTFYRTSLAGDPSEDVSLEDEIELQKLYLDIEGVRFPNRLSVRIEMPAPLGRAAVPGLILQPLVENAIKHAVSQTTTPVELAITADAVDGQLVLCVEDNGPGTARTGTNGDGPSGIGLSNVRDRLMARFGDTASLVHGPLPDGGYRACVRLPLVRHER